MQSYNLDDEIRRYSSQLMQQYNTRPRTVSQPQPVASVQLSSTTSTGSMTSTIPQALMMPAAPTMPMTSTTPQAPMMPAAPTMPMTPTTPQAPMVPVAPTVPMESTTPPIMPQQQVREQPEPKVEVHVTPEEQFKALAIKNPERGYIKVQTLAARGTLPIADATVTISKLFDIGEYVISRQKTNTAGQIEPVSLPALNKELSEQPGNPNPYITYKLVITHPESATIISNNVPVFAGVTSLQVVNLMPLATLPSGEEIIDNQEPADL